MVYLMHCVIKNKIMQHALLDLDVLTTEEQLEIKGGHASTIITEDIHIM